MNTINYHTFDRRGVFSGTVIIDPMGPLPGAGTTNAPPNGQAGKTRVWDGGQWTQVPNGQVLPAYSDPIEVKQTAAWERIKAHRDYLSENGGYKVSVGGGDKWFHSDAKSKTQQLSLVLLGANVSAVPPWKTMDGSKVTMSQTLAGQIFAAAVTQDGTLFAAAESHRAAMQASETPDAYDFSGGWPTVFGG